MRKESYMLLIVDRQHRHGSNNELTPKKSPTSFLNDLQRVKICLWSHVLCFLLLVKRAPHLHVILFVYIAHTLSLCTHILHLKRPHFASGELLNERLWEVAVLPQGRPCSTLVRVGYATAIIMESKEKVSG